ncbi:MAG: DMT family transporter [Acidimicrobiia bacterium]|nr:DMT family transporter [Acidimicrobiia bacterium]MDX2466852.1 DMT family transporter [Acidimicrobiia bacterium]
MTGARDASVTKAVGYAVAASLLWALAIILVKIGLEDIPRLTFASLRYVVGAFTLLVWRMVTVRSTEYKIPASMWRLLVALGILLYGIVPAAQFISLDLVEAVTFNFVFQAGIPLVLALLAGVVLKEATSRWEWLGVAVVVAGIFIFYPALPHGDEALGVLLAAVAAMGIGGSNLLQRMVMRGRQITALDATVIPMTLGSVGLFIVAMIVEPLPNLGRNEILLILLLGVVNTALAFTLWHHAMRTLNALHAGTIASAQTIEVPIFAFLILGESLTVGRIFGSVVVLAGILIVHYSKARAARTRAETDAVSGVGARIK